MIFILIVDRQDSRLSAYEEAFTDANAVVARAGSSEECLSLLSHFTPDALVLESELPGIERILAALAHRATPELVAVLLQSSEGRRLSSRLLSLFPRCEQHDTPLPPATLLKRLHQLRAVRQPRNGIRIPSWQWLDRERDKELLAVGAG